MEQFVIQRMGQEHGPYSLADMQTFVRAGSLPANAMVRREEGGSWFLAGDIPGLFSSRDWMAALLLSIFLGSLGVDRFYMGHIGLGIVKLVTCGGFGIWYLVDVILIAVGTLLDADGLPLRKP